MGIKIMMMKNRSQYYSDQLKPKIFYRWVATFVLACFYAGQAYHRGHCLLTFLLGMSLTILTDFFLSSYIDEDLDQPVSPGTPPILPTKASDELRPFVPFLPEYNFWCNVNKLLCVFIGLSFIPNIRLPGLGVDMIKYNYIPFYYGNKENGEYKGK
ncbi:hypothetical protein CASFOL_019983 [Castilleja foliolosa]|uniref:Uncharacterized protein n=1 Tax=Castilleja foliolosa TaxID=1961234 RepID=A0ABD3CZJ2_9LAMI